jgi:hypothetical protein
MSLYRLIATGGWLKQDTVYKMHIYALQTIDDLTAH